MKYTELDVAQSVGKGQKRRPLHLTRTHGGHQFSRDIQGKLKRWTCKDVPLLTLDPTTWNALEYLSTVEEPTTTYYKLSLVLNRAISTTWKVVEVLINWGLVTNLKRNHNTHPQGGGLLKITPRGLGVYLYFKENLQTNP